MDFIQGDGREEVTESERRRDWTIPSAPQIELAVDHILCRWGKLRRIAFTKYHSSHFTTIDIDYSNFKFHYFIL